MLNPASRVRPVLLGAAAILAGFGVVAALIAATGGDVTTVVHGWAYGAAGTPRNLVQTVAYAIPIVLVALGASPALRAGVLVIGAEGQMIGGAILTTAVLTSPWGYSLGWLAVPAGALLGVAGGASWSLLSGVPAARWGAPIIVAGILTNLVAAQLLTLLLLGELADPAASTPQSPPLPAGAAIPHLPGGLSTAVILVLALLGVAWWWHRTPTAVLTDVYARRTWLAARAGLTSGRVILIASTVSGAAAGIAGWVQLAFEDRLVGGITAGMGYSGLLVALLGRGRPIPILLAGCGVAALITGSSGVQLFTGVPSSIGYVTQAVLLVAGSCAHILWHRRAARTVAGD